MAAFDHAAALEGCARKEVAALHSLYEAEAGFLLAVATRIVRRRDIAADVLHDAFMDIWERAGSFDRSRGGGRAWITSIVRYRALKHVRVAGRETALDLDAQAEVADEGPDPFATFARTQEGERLRACLSRLEPERRKVVLLAYVEGLSQSEIAARLGAPLGTVKTWTRRSLIALKDCLS